MVWWTVFGAIKSKADVKKFRENVHASEDRIGGLRIRDERNNVIEFIRKNDDWSVIQYVSNLGALGWVTMEIASDTNPSYDLKVDDLIWKHRKALNAYFKKDADRL